MSATPKATGDSPLLQDGFIQREENSASFSMSEMTEVIGNSFFDEEQDIQQEVAPVPEDDMESDTSMDNEPSTPVGVHEPRPIVNPFIVDQFIEAILSHRPPTEITRCRDLLLDEIFRAYGIPRNNPPVDDPPVDDPPKKIVYQSNTGIDLTEFTVFPKLPMELRTKIWRLTFPRPQLVPLKICDRDNIIQPYHLRWLTPPPQPIALQINNESRAEALRSFEKVYVTGVSDRRVLRRSVYFNFKDDIFYIMGRRGELCIPGISLVPKSAQIVAKRGLVDNINFIHTDSAEIFNKIQRFMLGTCQFKKQLLLQSNGLPIELIRHHSYFARPLLPQSQHYYELPGSIKELLLISAVKGQRLLRGGVEFVENDEEEEKRIVEQDTGAKKKKNNSGHGLEWWIGQKKLIREMVNRAKEENPDWKAPSIHFGADKVAGKAYWEMEARKDAETQTE